MKNVRLIGLDVHADTIAVAVAEPAGEVRSLGMIPNRPESIRKLVKKLGVVRQYSDRRSNPVADETSCRPSDDVDRCFAH